MKLDDLLTEPAPSFDELFEMLEVCHEYITTQCVMSAKLSAYLSSHGADGQARQIIRNIMHYFDVAGSHRHVDEEEDLFPLLVIEDQRLRSPVIEVVASLFDGHRFLETS